MAYIDQYNLVHGQEGATLRSRIEVAVVNAVAVVVGENVNTANHAARVLWAKKALTSKQSTADMAEAMHWAVVVGNATVATKGNGATDAELQSAVNSLIDIFSALV